MDTGKTKEDLIQEAKGLTFGQGRKRFTPCPYGCGLVKAGRFEEHLQRAHANKPLLASKARKAKVRATKSTDALLHSVSGGRPESNRRKY